MSKRTLLILLSTLRLGGSESKMVRLANALHERGEHVHLVYLNEPSDLKPDLHAGIPISCLERDGKVSWPAARRLARYLAAHQIYTILCVNLYPALYAFAARLLQRSHRIEIAVSLNTSEFLTVKGKLSMLLYAPLLRRADRLVFGCRFQQLQWASRYRLPDRTCTYIYNGVDVDYFSARTATGRTAARQALKIPDTDFVVGSVGQLRPEKSYISFVRAVALLRSAHHHKVFGLLVGEGPQRSKIEAEVRRLGLDDNFRLTGQMRDVRLVLAAMDAFVLTSVAVETFSNAALEAMAMGLPVVVSRVGGAAEMVEHEHSGFLFDKHDLRALVEALNDLIEDLSLRQQIAANAMRRAKDKFSFSHMVDQYTDVLGLQR